jgi:eukaryotic-like serine/threonine-protein kinase
VVDLHDAVAPEPTGPGLTRVDFLEVTLERRVAEGRFAEVWRGVGADGHPVALKVATSDVGARMLRAEDALGETVEGCKRVVPILAFQDGARPRLVMPWIGEGRTLRDALRAVKSEDDRARLTTTLAWIAESMAQLHAAGVVHGDLKPENVLLDERGAPWLTDFGLSREVWRVRLAGSLSLSMRTQDDVTGGTLAYLPPEAVKGAEPSRVGDVYALGVMLHEALLGRRPDKVVSPEEVKRLLPEPAALLLLRALAFAPEDRYPDARALHRDLREALPVLALVGLARRWLFLRRHVVAGLAALFVALRYTAVVGLLALYVVIGVMAYVKHPTVAIAYAPFLLLHIVVRWEGPETDTEAAARRAGQVLLRARRR